MSEPTPPMSQGSAPVAIILALALAATVGVSAQSWDVKLAAKQSSAVQQNSGATATAAPAAERGSLVELLVGWWRGERLADCRRAEP